jgi:predicted ArsR family transcriptional regulator
MPGDTATGGDTATRGGVAAAPPAKDLTADEFSAAVTAITSAFGDPTRRQIYLFAREHEDEGVTASEVAQRFELHANVARHHLDKLAAGAYLEARTGKGSGSAGRPSKRFVATGTALVPELPVRRDDLVLSLLGRALELLPREAAEAMAEEVGIEYGRAMAASVSPEGGAQRSFRSALHAVADALTAHGFAAHAEGLGAGGVDDDDTRIVTDHCPFGGSLTSPVICAVDRGMVKGMLAALYGDTSPATFRSRAQGDDTCVTAVPVSL